MIEYVTNLIEVLNRVKPTLSAEDAKAVQDVVGLLSVQYLTEPAKPKMEKLENFDNLISYWAYYE